MTTTEILKKILICGLMGIKMEDIALFYYNFLELKNSLMMVIFVCLELIRSKYFSQVCRLCFAIDLLMGIKCK